MPEIGETLREARMRRRIDMTEVESATKIRGKYLRALESEEWDLLPGPTFVKTFLRTYAEYLGLDARLLVEEYRQRFERPSSQELTPFRRPSRRPRRRVGALVGPGAVLFGGLVVLLAVFYVLGTWGDDDDGVPARVQPTATPDSTPSEERSGSGSGERERERPARRVRLQLVATGPVYVCLVDARGRQLIDEETLQAGARTRVYRGRRFRTNFGNANVQMRVDGRLYDVAASADPVGYELRPGRRPRLLSDDARPDCSE